MVSVNKIYRIPGNDLRIVESCLRGMWSEGFQITTNIQTAEEGAKCINQFISSLDWEYQRKDEFARSLYAQAKQNLLPDNELDWLKNSERACYFVWVTISKSQFFSAPNSPVFLPSGMHPEGTLYATSYTQLNLKNGPSNSDERFKEVVNYFDRVTQPLDWQRVLVAHLKSQWGIIFNSRKPFSWLRKDDEDQIRWAWEYLGKLSLGTSKPSVFGFYPPSIGEMYLAIYAAFDTWGESYETKRHFLIDFNKAWQQKKHRDSRIGKKVCNLVLRDEVKDKLDQLAKQRGKKLNQLVEELIENEYDKL